MQELKELIKRCKHKILNGGKCPMLVEIRDKYLNHYGISNRHIKPYKGSMNDKVGIKIANAYEELEHSPDNFLVKICYEQLAREVLNQFDFLNERENIIYEPFTSEGEPYENSYEMLKDIHQNHLFFFKTESGFGENNSSESNKMLEKTDFKYNGYEFVINDIFRIVHDIFGHAMNGYSFGPKGEDMAWHTHMQMFSPLAAAAITTETRGQNCWVNFGPHMRNKRGEIFNIYESGYIPPQKRPFAQQKMGLLPSDISGIQIIEKNGVAVAEVLTDWNFF
jgi:hypothetical protein